VRLWRAADRRRRRKSTVRAVLEPLYADGTCAGSCRDDALHAAADRRAAGGRGRFYSLEREEIIESEEADAYSEQMLERVRVAANLMADLDVNLPGVAIIVRLREELSATRRQLEELARRLQGKG
jgi:hypothetical protein